MQCMLLIYMEEGGWDRLTPAQQAEGMAAYMAYNRALEEAGAMVTGQRLQPSATATTVRMQGGAAQVLDGPYADTKEQCGGFYLVEVPDMEAAVAWAARCPGARHGRVEVRPLVQMPAPAPAS